MANIALIKGAGLAANRFTDVTKGVRQAVLRGEQAMLRVNAERKRLEENNARAIAQLPMLDQSKIAPEIRDWAMVNAMGIRQEAISAINNPDLGPAEKQMAISKAIEKVNGIAAKGNDFKQFKLDFADYEKDDISLLNSEDRMRAVNDVHEGRYKINAEGNFDFFDEDGNLSYTKTFDDVVNTKLIDRRDDAYKKQLESIAPVFDKLGVSGRGIETFNSKVQAELAKIEEYSDVDLASIAVDNLGRKELLQDILPAIKEDINDGKFDNPELKERVLNTIAEEYETAAKTAYDAAVKDRRALLDVKNKEKPTPPDETVILGAESAANLINDPEGYFRSVSSDQTEYNESEKLFTLTAGNDKITYDLLNKNDITRLFNEIQTNKSYTSATRKKLEDGLRILLQSPKFKEYQSQATSQLPRPTRVPVDTGNLPIEDFSFIPRI